MSEAIKKLEMTIGTRSLGKNSLEHRPYTQKTILRVANIHKTQYNSGESLAEVLDPFENSWNNSVSCFYLQLLTERMCVHILDYHKKRLSWVQSLLQIKITNETLRCRKECP